MHLIIIINNNKDDDDDDDILAGSPLHQYVLFSGALHILREIN